MKLSLSNLDIKVCAQELKNAIGARVGKIYELDSLFLLRLHIPKKGQCVGRRARSVIIRMCS